MADSTFDFDDFIRFDDDPGSHTLASPNFDATDQTVVLDMNSNSRIDTVFTTHEGPGASTSPQFPMYQESHSFQQFLGQEMSNQTQSNEDVFLGLELDMEEAELRRKLRENKKKREMFAQRSNAQRSDRSVGILDPHTVQSSNILSNVPSGMGIHSGGISPWIDPHLPGPVSQTPEETPFNDMGYCPDHFLMTGSSMSNLDAGPYMPPAFDSNIQGSTLVVPPSKSVADPSPDVPQISFITSDQVSLELSSPTTTPFHESGLQGPLRNTSSTPKSTSRSRTRTGKRKRSSEDKVKNEIQQLSRSTGASGICFDIIPIGNTPPSHKIKRTQEQTERRKLLKAQGGACFLCYWVKKPCSGDRPCERCVSYRNKRVNEATGFKFTCDVRTNLSDFGIFESPNVRPELYNPNKLDTTRYLLDIFDTFKYGSTNDHSSRMPISYSALADNEIRLLIHYHTIHRWKRSLLYMNHTLEPVISSLQGHLQVIGASVLKILDKKMLTCDWPTLVAAIILVYNEVHQLKESGQMNDQQTEHLEASLLNRLGVICSRSFDDSSKPRPEQAERISMAGFINSFEALSVCLPAKYRHTQSLLSSLISSAGHTRSISRLKRESPISSARCSSNDSHTHGDLEQPECYCTSISESIPHHILALFEISQSSLAEHLHIQNAAVPPPEGFRYLNVAFEIFTKHKIQGDYMLLYVFRLTINFALELTIKNLSKTLANDTELRAIPPDCRRLPLILFILEMTMIMYSEFTEMLDIFMATRGPPTQNEVLAVFRDWQDRFLVASGRNGH